MVSEQASAISATSVSSRLTNTPTTSAWRRNSAPIAAAVCRSTLRGLGSWKISPTAHAPSSTASSASSRRVIPQIFTCTRLRLGEHARPAGALIRGGGLVVEGRRARAELDLLRLQLVVAVVLDRDPVTGPVVVDGRGHVVGLRHLLALELDDHVTAEDHARVRVDLPRTQSDLVGGAAGPHVLDQHAAGDRQVHRGGEIRIQR